MTTDSTKPEVPPKSECLHTKNRHRAFSTSDGFVEGGYVAEVALFADEGWYCSERGWVKSLKYCERHGPMMIRYTQHEESCKLLVLLSSLRGVGCLDKLLHCGVESGVAKLRDGKCVSPFLAPDTELRVSWRVEYRAALLMDTSLQ